MAPDISTHGTILIKSICTSTIYGGNNAGNGDLVLMATINGNEANSIKGTLSKKIDETGTFTFSLPINYITNNIGIEKVTALALQNGAQGVVTNKAYNAEIGKFVIDAAAMENTTFDVMAGDIVQLFDGVSVNPTIEMYHQPKSVIATIEEFQNNLTWTLVTTGTTFSYGVGGVPMTITRGVNGVPIALGTHIGLATSSNAGLLDAIKGNKITVNVEAEITSIETATDEYFYSAVITPGPIIEKEIKQYTKSSRIMYTFDWDVPGGATDVTFVLGIIGNESTSSVVKVYSWNINIEPTQKIPLGVAQSSGDRGDTIEVCTRGITTMWAYTGGATLTLTNKGYQERPVENMTIAEGAGAVDLTNVSRAPYLGKSYNDQANITAGASRVDRILGNIQGSI